MVKAQRYKSEGPGIDSRCRRDFSQDTPGGKGGRCVRLINHHLHVPASRNLGVLTSWNLVGLFRPVMGQLVPCIFIISI